MNMTATRVPSSNNTALSQQQLVCCNMLRTCCRCSHTHTHTSYQVLTYSNCIINITVYQHKYSKLGDSLKLRINTTPNFITIVTGHGNIRTYLNKYKIIDNPICPCNDGEQSVDHIIYECNLQRQERDKLKAEVTRTEKWPVVKDKLITKYYINFKRFTDNLILENE